MGKPFWFVDKSDFDVIAHFFEFFNNFTSIKSDFRRNSSKAGNIYILFISIIMKLA